MAVNLCDPLLTRAIPQRLRDKSYTLQNYVSVLLLVRLTLERRSIETSRFLERRHQSFDAKRSNKLRCGRFGRFAAAALQQQAQHQHQNIPSDRGSTQLDYSNGLSISPTISLLSVSSASAKCRNCTSHRYRQTDRHPFSGPVVTRSGLSVIFIRLPRRTVVLRFLK